MFIGLGDEFIMHPVLFSMYWLYISQKHKNRLGVPRVMGPVGKLITFTFSKSQI